MVKLFRNDGIYDVTEALYESIKQNNPKIIEQSESIERQILAEDKREYDWNYIEQKVKKTLQTTIGGKKQYKAYSDDVDNALNDIKNEYVSDIEKYKNKKKSIDSMIDEISKEIGSKVNIPVNVTSNDAVQGLDKEKIDKSVNKTFGRMGSSKQLSNKLPLDVYQTLGEALRDKYLHQNINVIENDAVLLIKRLKYLIHAYAGIAGGSRREELSRFDDDNETLNNGDNQKRRNDTSYSHNTQPAEPKKVMAAANDTKKDYEPSSKWTKFTNALKLGIGGFEFSSFEKTDDMMGKAIKYFLATTYNSQTLTKKMVMTYYNYRKDPTQFEDYKGNGEKFKNMCETFLSNITYMLKINNSKYYNSILRAIRSDDNLNAKVRISTRTPPQMLDVREDVLSFMSNSNNNLLLTVVATPLFAKGSEIMKELKPMWNSAKKLKG